VKKVKLLKETVALIRRLGPKPIKHQAIWKRALTVMVDDAPVAELKTELVSTYWEESDIKSQKEEIAKQKEELVKLLNFDALNIAAANNEFDGATPADRRRIKSAPGSFN
jgi:hypothetical protein